MTMEFYVSAVWRIELKQIRQERSFAAAITRAGNPTPDEIQDEDAVFILSQNFPDPDDIATVVMSSGRSVDDVIAVERMANVFVPDWLMENIKDIDEEDTKGGA